MLTKQPNRDWYLRMTTKSGCTDTVPSDPSQVVRVIEPDIQAIGNPPVTPKRAEARITWNAPKPNNAATKDHFIYESETHYYIWENDSVGNGIAAVQNPNNWYLRGDTTARRYDIKSNVCGEMIGIRIEAREYHYYLQAWYCSW